MKANALIYFFCLSALLSFGQPSITKIFIVKNEAQALGPTQLYTTLDPNQVISIKNNGYALIETDADSLGFLKGTTYSDSEYQPSIKKQEPVYIKIEKGKSYYFKIGPASATSSK